MSREEILRSQLAELNSRSRWYSSQNWHLPFAYIGLSSLLVGTIANKMPDMLPWVSLFSSILGFCTLAHMIAIENGIKRSVSAIQCVEDELGLERTAQYKPFSHLWPMMLIVIFGIVACVITSWVLFSENIHDSVRNIQL